MFSRAQKRISSIYNKTVFRRFRSWSTCTQSRDLSFPLPNLPFVYHRIPLVECPNTWNFILAKVKSFFATERYQSRRKKDNKMLSWVTYSELITVKQLRSTSIAKMSEVPRSTLQQTLQWKFKVIKQFQWFGEEGYAGTDFYHTRPQLSWNSTSLISWNEEGITLKPFSAS